MEYREAVQCGIRVPSIGLGTWAFGSDAWWGHQDDRRSWEVLDEALSRAVNLVDTAPVYGRGHSEEVIGEFIAHHRCRDRVILATKTGLKWREKDPRIFHDLSPRRMREEFDQSRRRLRTDYFDIYQVHWPDSDTPIEATAEQMRQFYEKGQIRAVGVSNYSAVQMETFMTECPLHFLQPPYNMFRREIESELLPFCREKGIAVLAYAPLHSGILTGKFFFDRVKIPNDILRRKHRDLREPRAGVNKETLSRLRSIARDQEKSLGQLVLQWTAAQEGITSVLTGARSRVQMRENALSQAGTLSPAVLAQIREILEERDRKLAEHDA
ncbi:MAG: general stress protein [Candidatus Omnitrophica bacterium]|nr:general stress protein [Candidatus Omnitrophota bacterium]